MPQPRSRKPSRNLPEHIKRAVDARDKKRCQNCGVVTEFIHYDHIFPFDLGGPTTVENMQSLCPTCNTSKGNKIQCHKCRHWTSPDNARCTQCGVRFPYSKHSKTLAGKIENLSHRVGRAVLIGVAALVLLLFIVGGFYTLRYFRGAEGEAADQAASVTQIVNSSFTVTPTQHAFFPVAIPAGAKNARVVGGFKVTSGGRVDCLIFDEVQYGRWSGGNKGAPPIWQKRQTTSARFRQPLQAGNYYLVFSGEGASDTKTVAAEFYLKHD
jgi:5-methylcytosine-specific restriction enzyme A